MSSDNDLQLDPRQRRLVHSFLTTARHLVVGIGPAGAGNTTAMQAVAQAWRITGRRVIPLAPSAAAAQVLADEVGCRADNLHKFQHTHTARRADAGDVDPWFTLQPGDLVLVDEAGMAGTGQLDWLTSYARERGALIRLLGDPAQLSPVQAGGALRLIAHDTAAAELTDRHRFNDPDEAHATLAIREGDPIALTYYSAHDRIRSGTRADLIDQTLDAWRADHA
jgi:ATP-dependent exoDNAse (exonuclease V) alpha subunit